MKRRLKKRIKYAIATALLKAYVAVLELTSNRITIGQKIIDEMISKQQPCILCFWHQHIVTCVYYLLDWQKQGMKTGFLISPSGDGALAAKIFVKHGVTLISGSSGRSGAQTMRKVYMAIKRDGLSPVATPDGPRGPIYDFKPGPLLLASMTGAPIVPIAASSSRYWQFNSWDKFILPKWFSKFVLVVGKPVYIEQGLPTKELRPKCAQLSEILMGIKRQSVEILENQNK
ncbi:MAG: lysophospholipid acyltransferase family protein [Gammaproteobacteria bacterium]|nr:lysophospholipid acyltransferase family protein [Gammaproteobacteria bacterium]